MKIGEVEKRLIKLNSDPEAILFILARSYTSMSECKKIINYSSVS